MLLVKVQDNFIKVFADLRKCFEELFCLYEFTNSHKNGNSQVFFKRDQNRKLLKIMKNVPKISLI